MLLFLFGANIFIFFIVLILFKRIFTTGKKDKRVDGVDILKLIKTGRFFPLCPSQGWSLYDCIEGVRVWYQDVGDPSCTVFACAGTLQRYTKSVLQTLTCSSKLLEWDPTVNHVHSVKPIHSEQGCEVGHDILELDRDSAYNLFFDHINKVFPFMFKRKPQHIERYYHQEENHCCWMLEVNKADGEWCYFLAQPLEGIDKCLLTIVTNPGATLTVESIVKKLMCLQDLFKKKHSRSLPFLVLTLPRTRKRHRTSSTRAARLRTVSYSGQPTEQLSGGIFVPKQTLIVDKTNRSKSESDCGLVSTQQERESQPQGMNSESHPAENEQNADMAANTIDTGNNVIPEASNLTPEENNEVFEIIGPPLPDANLNGHENETDKSATGQQGAAAFPEKQQGEEDSDYGPVTMGSEAVSEMELYVVPPLTIEEESYKKALTLANQSAAELMTEVMIVSNNSIHTQQSGWVIEEVNNNKDVVILRKSKNDYQNVKCYLAKGLIKAPPDVVWEAVRNPRTRFTYDEILKQLDVIHDYGSGLKLLYMYHELSLLFRTEARDFCVLQGERDSGDQKILSYLSVDCESCPRAEGAQRGMFLPSGWVIEPPIQKSKHHSMVTYLVQMDVRSTPSAIMDDIVTKQPLAVSLLRQYLEQTPFLLNHKLKRRDTT